MALCVPKEHPVGWPVCGGEVVPWPGLRFGRGGGGGGGKDRATSLAPHTASIRTRSRQDSGCLTQRSTPGRG